MDLIRNVVGGDLVLWPPECAAERHRWEVAAADILRANGFLQVVTPHLYKKVLQQEFSDWFDEPLLHFEEDDTKPECADYIALGNKHLPHVQIFRATPHSYRELPIRYFEIGEHYSVDICNMVAIYLTTFCETKDQDVEDKLCMSVFKEIQKISKEISPHSGEFHRGERNNITYTASDNTKKPICVVMANERFTGV